ncbi:hypothetical protein H8E77_33900, partial [bacterium]|nr:hypothetical protein [bacterium]
GIENLARAGFSAIMLPPNARMREWLLGVGHRRTSWAIYAPLGYAFDYSPKVNPEAIDKWAQKLAAPFSKAGYEMTDVAAYAMSDEPGW